MTFDTRDIRVDPMYLMGRDVGLCVKHASTHYLVQSVFRFESAVQSRRVYTRLTQACTQRIRTLFRLQISALHIEYLHLIHI